MKRLILFIGLSIITLYGYSQNSVLTTLYRNYAQYKNYADNNNLSKALNSQKILEQGNTLMDLYLLGALTGRSGLMDSAMTAFNTLYGKQHIAPDIALSALSSLKVDSISFDDGVTWLNASNILTSSQIQDMIDASGVDEQAVIDIVESYSINLETLNTNLDNFRDTLNVIPDIESTIRGWIGDSTLTISQLITLITDNSASDDDVATAIDNYRDTLTYMYPAEIESLIASAVDGVDPSGDSSWTSVTIDTLLFNPSGSKRIRSNGPSNGIFYFEYAGGYGVTIIAGSVDGGFYTKNAVVLNTSPTSTSAPIRPNYSDANTGYSWVSADKLGLVAGAQSTFTSEYNSGLSKKINNLMDSAVVTGLSATRVHAGSVITANGTHVNLVSFTSAPEVYSVPIVAPDGSISLAASSTFGGGMATTGSPDLNQITYFSSSSTITGSSNTYMDEDSVSLNGTIIATGDSVYLPYLIGSINGDMSLGLSATGAIITDSLPDAGWALKAPLKKAKDMLSDTYGGEIAWYDINGKKHYTIGNSWKSAIPRLQAMNEFLLKQNEQQDIELEELRNRVSVLEQLLLKQYLEKCEK